MLQSSYLWGLNYRPFNSSEWSRVKRALLNHFLENFDHSSDPFLRNCEEIASDFGMTYTGTEESRLAIYSKLSELESFRTKGRCAGPDSRRRLTGPGPGRRGHGKNGAGWSLDR